jgi:toxin ParE1/3/4
MGRVDKLPTARSDLIEIWQYIADDSPEDADRFLDTLEEKISLLADNPEMGKRREELAEGLRSFPVSNYMIYYRPHGGKEGIVVVRVLNATQNITELHFE